MSMPPADPPMHRRTGTGEQAGTTPPSPPSDRTPPRPTASNAFSGGTADTVIQAGVIFGDVNIRQPGRGSGHRRLEEILQTFAPRPVTEEHRLPSHYMDPSRQIVRFVPRPELDDLQAWCRTGNSKIVRLVHGPGGAGKTRLSIQLTELMRREPDWMAGRLTNRTLVDLDELAGLLAGRKVLMCIDYAEDWAYELPKLLTKVAHTDCRSLRILLLARTVGAWWRTLSSDPDIDELIDGEPAALGPLDRSVDRAEVLRWAYQDFRAAIVDDGPRPVPPVLLDAAGGEGNVLGLHAGALSVVLHEKEHGTAPDHIDPRRALHAVLKHERRWWARWIRSRDSGLDPHRAKDLDNRTITDRILIVPALFPATDAAQAEEALDAALAGLVPSETIQRVATALHSAYPNTRSDLSRHWGLLQPDPLGEMLVLDFLGEPAGVQGCLDTVCRIFATGVGQTQAEQALLVLVRASGLAAADSAAGAARSPARQGAADCIGELLARYPQAFLPAAMSVVAGLADPGPMIEIIVSRLDTVPGEVLRQATRNITINSPAMAGLEAALLQRYLGVAGDNPDDHNLHDLANVYSWLGDAYERAGEAAEALSAGRTAVELYRQAAVPDRADLLADLADSRAALARRVEEAGLHEEALDLLSRTIDDYQDLVDRGWETFEEALFWSKNSQAHLLHKMGSDYAGIDELYREARRISSRFEQHITARLPPMTEGESRGPVGPPDRPEERTPRTLIIPVGHSVGPLFTEPGGPDSYEIRYADGIFSIDHEELRIWACAHGTPAKVIKEPSTREVIIGKCPEIQPEKAAEVIDRLLDIGLLSEVETGTQQAREFAYRHQVEPLAIGLGNSWHEPWYFSIGLPGTPLVNVHHDVYHLWMFSHRHASLWDAIEYVAMDRREEAVHRLGVETDPGRILENFLDALPAMIATSTAYVDRVR